MLLRASTNKLGKRLTDLGRMLELSQRCASKRPVVECRVTPRNLLDVPTFGARVAAGCLRGGFAARSACSAGLDWPTCTTHTEPTRVLAPLHCFD